MPGKWVVVILMLVGVWQIVGNLIEKAGKKKQDQRLKDIASQGQRQASGRGTSAPASRSITDRAEALAARRRAQLDELRQRRSGRTVGGATAGPAASPGPTAVAPPTAGRPVVTQPTGRAQVSPPQRSTPQRQAPVRPSAPRPPRTAPVAATPPRAVATPQPVPVEGESSTQRVVADAETPQEIAHSRGYRPRQVVLDEPLGPHALRQMVLFREILEPPVALRDRQAWERM